MKIINAMKKRKSGLFILVFLISILLVGCANQLPPSGGPIDPTPPEIISFYPEDGALNYGKNSVRIEFKHYVDERTLEESIFISPNVGTLEFDWSGTEVEITFSEKLRPNTTYVVNIGTDVQDKYRNNTRMAKAFTLAFSTGSEIDNGGIEGSIFPRLPSDVMSGVMIFAYLLDGLNPDTLNPATTNPDFITQTGKNGDFFLRHIPFGNYRIFAIRDEYRNLVYDQGVDEYGVQSGIISVTPTDTLVTDVFMRLSKEDITGPMLVKAASPDRNHVVAEFSKSIQEESIASSSFSIIDTLEKKPLGVITVFLSPSSLNSFIAVTKDQDSTKMYRIIIQGIKDSIGNSVQTQANSMLFQGSPIADTLIPKLASISIKDSVQGIDLQPKIVLVFSDALAKPISLNFINLFNSKNQSVPIKKKLVNDAMITVEPETELSSLSWYTLRADLHNFHDWVGRAFKDSIRSWHFETLDVEDLASIDGVISDIGKSHAGERLYIAAIQMEEKKAKQYMAAANISGKFIFPQVVGGLYQLQAFGDRNDNGVYDVGKPFPFVYSERLSPLTDSLKVRARWAVEGVNILMH